jgi:hypothetical protein
MPGRIAVRIRSWSASLWRGVRWWLWRPGLKMFQRALGNGARGLGE